MAISSKIINTNAYDRGFADYSYGSEFLDCPYYHNTIEADSWEEGWADAWRVDNQNYLQ